ncbi:MAG: hypothetical protein ABSB10_01470 [Candidatus Bathyarchaeia archaeon]|jgi:hypothetical protein
MVVTQAKFGEPIPLLVDAKGFNDGKAVTFKIWRQVGQNQPEEITKIVTSVKRGQATEKWPAHEAKDKKTGELIFKREKDRVLKDKISPQPQKEQYSFTAIIDEEDPNKKKESKGTPIELTFPMEIYVEDTKGRPLNDAKFTVTFSDKTKKDGVLKNGRAKIDDAPAGKFTIELEDYDFVFT